MHDPCIFPRGLYIHLPFCPSICTYCDFAVERYSTSRSEIYLNALEKELSIRIHQLLPNGRFAPKTIFLGGGTPSAFSHSEMKRFFDILERNVDTSSVAEFSIEANPGTVDSEKLELLLKHGVNRISFGVQSFQGHLLQLLGRVHGSRHGPEAVRLARSAGFKNVAIDLMHGLPNQSREDLRRDLEEAIALNVDHISAYGLIYEDGTPIKTAVERGVLKTLTPEEEAAHYLQIVDTLEAAGYRHYETSNYAREGCESMHNLIYWRNEAYLGVGVSAASFIDFARTVNDKSMEGYMRAALADGNAIVSSEKLSPQARAREALVLELRLRRGVDRNEFRERWGCDPLEENAAALERMMSEGLMERLPNDRIRISRKGLPVADGIMSDFV
jgi:oxygen-independent coproporphyrinogen-3 oxidase